MRSALTLRAAERPRPHKKIPPTRRGFGHGQTRLGLRQPALPLIVIELDIGHSLVTLSDEDAELLRDVAAAQAGRSAAARDLSLLLNQALSGRRRIALQRAEANTLRHIITADRRLTYLVTIFEQPGSDTQAS